MKSKNALKIATLSFLVGFFMCAGGLFVLFKLSNSLSVIEIRFLMGITLLIFGLYLFQVFDKQYLSERIEELEKRLQKLEINDS